MGNEDEDGFLLAALFIGNCVPAKTGGYSEENGPTNSRHMACGDSPL